MKKIEHDLTLDLVRRASKDYFWNVSFKEKKGGVVAIGIIVILFHKHPIDRT